MLDEENQILKVSETDDDGSFSFNDIDSASQYKIMLDNTQLLVSQFGDNYESFKTDFKADGTITYKSNDEVQPTSDLVVFTSIDLRKSEQETKTNQEGYFNLNMNSEDEQIAMEFQNQPITKKLSYKNNDEIISAYIKFYGQEDSLDIKRYIDRIEIDPSERLPSDSLGEEFANLLFDFDKFFLREKSKNILDRLSTFLEKHPEIEVTFSGHTDWMGTEAYNMTLSENRSKSAEKYTLDKGVDKNRITLEWHGESKPAVPNANPDGTDNPENRQLNRRVEIKLNVPQTAELILSL